MVQPSVTVSGKVVQFFRAVGLFRPSYTVPLKDGYVLVFSYTFSSLSRTFLTVCLYVIRYPPCVHTTCRYGSKKNKGVVLV